MINSIFQAILNMSLTASIVIILVLFARIFLKKAPKVISYALWAVVLFRLLCPISFTTDFSMLSVMNVPVTERGNIEYIPSNFDYADTPTVTLPLIGNSEAVNNSLPQGDVTASVNPVQVYGFIAAIIWICGMIILLGYSVFQYMRLNKRLVGAVCKEEKIFLSDHMDSAFVLGLFQPRIYLPTTLTDKEQAYILKHEQYHIHRGDHIIKLVAYLALCIHWFNPLVWLAFMLSGKDMEMSCDEAVMNKMGKDIRADYAQSLLRLSSGKRVVAATPLAFGEGNTKSRIKNVLNYRRPAFWVTGIAVIAIVLLGVSLICNPSQKIPVTEIQDTSELTVEETAWYEEQASSKGAAIMQTATGYLFFYQGEEDLYGYYSAKAVLKDGTLRINVKSHDAVSEENMASKLLARITVETNSVKNVEFVFDGGNLTLEQVASGPMKVEQPAMIYYFNAVFVQSSSVIDIDPETLIEAGKVSKIVPKASVPQNNGEANRNINNAIIYENNGTSIIVFINDEYKLFELTDDYTLYTNTNSNSQYQGEEFADHFFETAKTELAAYPQEYSSKQAKADGGVVFSYTSQYNMDILYDFLDVVKNGNGAAEITLVQYTVEGDAILTELNYSGGNFYAVIDSSRDGYAGDGEKYSNYQCSYLNEVDDTSGTIYLVLSDTVIKDWSDLQALWNSSRIGYTLVTYPAKTSWIESAMNDFVGDDFTSIGIESNDSGVKQSFALKGNDLGAFQQWMKNATYQATWFAEGETPNQRGSLRSYTCTPVGGRDNEVFTLYEIGNGEYYLQWKSNWYYVFSENGVSFMD